MVFNARPCSRTLALALGALFVGAVAHAAEMSTLPATPAPATEPAEGAIAAQDLFSPVDFVVVDAEATTAAFARAGEATPMVLRTVSGTSEVAIAQFNAAFDRARSAFLDSLEATFGERQVGSREINSARFRNFRNAFQAANPLFPVNLVLAQTWAKGYDGEPARERLVAALRDVTQSRLIGETRPASTFFVTTIQPSDRMRTWGELEPHTRIVARDEVLSIERAGEELRRGLDALDRTAGAFLTGLIQTNVVEDHVLTGLLFQERFGGRATSRRFAVGDPLARAGEPLDHWSILALAHLHRIGGEPVPSERSLTQSKGMRPASGALGYGGRRENAAPDWWIFAMIGGGVVVAVLVFGGLLWISGRRTRRSHPRWLGQPTEAPASTPVTREALLPHLARALRDQLVHVLFAQRGALLANEAAASKRVEELEARLARLQPAIAEKIRAYEKRIARLEVELDEKDKETRDLISAKLVLARQELDAEISRNRLDWN